jgi:CDP-diacylglycerol--serine O-phosphatidyltransferase
MKGEFDLAAMALGFAVVCDGMDGRIARLTNSTSEFGVQMDSLADVITFGLAPAVLAYIWGCKYIIPTLPPLAKHVQQIGWIVSFAFVICGAMRLARFNIQSTRPQPQYVPTNLKKDFVGMPIPAGAGLIAAIIHFDPAPIMHWSVGALWNILVGFLSFLMISTIRYPSFKRIDLKSRKSHLNFYLLALMMALIYLYSQIVLLLIATVYASSGFVLKMFQLIKHRNDAILPAEKLYPSPEDTK